MRILVLSNLYPPHEIGGYEIRCRDVVDRLRAAGHDIRVLTSDHQVAGRPVDTTSHVARRLKVHGMYGHPWLSIPKLRQLEHHNHAALIDEIATFQPEVVHVWNMGGISKSLLLRLEATDLPVVYDISDHWIARSLRADVWLSWWNEPRSAPVTFLRQLLTAIGYRRGISSETPTGSWDFLRFPRIYFCSAFMRDLTVSRGWPVEHAAVIHCGIETAAFPVKTDHSRFRKLLWVGRLAEDKDPLTPVRALASCSDTSLTLDLYGHGEAEYIATLDAEIETLGLSGRVIRRSASAAEMKQLYSQYDALLFTSNWGEPFALTPLEAMASGLPVITSLDGGQAELARHGENSLVAEAANPSLYAERIAELAAAPPLRAHLSATALEEVRRRFDIAVITAEIEAYLLASLPS
ncbi:glycosyltransferase involved in cell wall biosynthesis [Haloferula luteola]|uniref:Glycosyltransferase involved in cell wall biosynthesis n=1 Tax=Haloferula luteola TaxID=595692 RepID=A0A840V1D4_9BACT|nr:glycosyltransferase family 4 protein [Haloferula luteola]MBB5350876.1 glycosyltransferase involved in cell wall biosynthesis [Haloferula luteola]